MGILRLICVALAVAGSISLVVGTAVLWSAGVALIVGGALAIVAAVMLYDPKAAE